MNFSVLEDSRQNWHDILVIGKTIARDNKKYHIVGMTLSDEAKLYIIEPYCESEHKDRIRKKPIKNLEPIIFRLKVL